MGLLARLFRGGEVSRSDLEDLAHRFEGELTRQASVIRQLETEQTMMHDQVRKWMRRAVAAERAIEGAQLPHVAPAPSPPAAPPPTRMTMWGARRRIAERRQREGAARAEARAALQTPGDEGEENGVHP